MTYWATTYVPALVEQAMTLAEQLHFTASCIPEVGRLLQVLASQPHYRSIGEIGTGCGVGAAWIASVLTPPQRLYTVELDMQRATAAQQLFVPYHSVQVMQGDWRKVLQYAPFDLLFVDATPAKQHAPEQLLAVVRIGGLVLLDDLTPEALWPDEWRGKPDPLRRFWLNDQRVRAVEVGVTPTSAVILATRVQ
jgi:predicted O-methyltransferase YrrM